MRTNEKMFENVKPHLPLALFIADFYKKKQEQCIFLFYKTLNSFLLSLKSSKKGENSAIWQINSYKLGSCPKPDIDYQIRT